MAEDDDGFSDPNPADVPDELREIDPEDVIIHDGSISCNGCRHQEVCQIFNGFANMVEGEMGEEPPVDPVDLAVVCSLFLPEDGEDTLLADAQ